MSLMDALIDKLGVRSFLIRLCFELWSDVLNQVAERYLNIQSI